MTDFTFLTYFGGTVIALFVGFLTGIFGVGGGFLMVPALMILLGVPGNIAVGTGLVAMLVNSSFGIVKRHGSGTVDIKLGLTLAAGSIFGVLLGALIMRTFKKMPPLMVLAKEQRAVQYILLWLFLLLLVFLFGLLAFDLRQNKGKSPEKRTGLFSRVAIPPYVHFNTLDSPRISLIPVIVLGFIVGILTGLLGVSGGVILLPALVYLVGQRTVKAAGTSLLLVWVSSAIGTLLHLTDCNVHPFLLAAMLIGGLIGTNFGTHTGLKLAGHKIRQYFIYVIALAVVMIAVKLCFLTLGPVSD